MNYLVPNSSTGKIGNTVQSSPKFVWFFTFNNYNLIDFENKIVPKFQVLCKSGSMQEEIGKEGTKHIQGCLHFIKKVRITQLKKINSKIHWEACRNEEAAVMYCLKEETSNGKQWIWDNTKPKVKPKFQQEIKLTIWMNDIIKIIESVPDSRSIYWYWEDIGGIGKTTLQKYIYGHYNDVIVLSGKGSDMKNGIVEYEKTNLKLPKTILINVPRSSKDYISYTGIEEVKDMFFYSGKYEGGMISGPCPHVIIFANEPPCMDKMSKDRWKVVEINPCS